MWPTEESWRATVPGLVARYAERWGLTLGEDHVGGTASRVVRARTADGVDAVLKVSLPHREARGEAAALRWWDGDGAVRLLAEDPDDPYALLLEPCVPGTRLSDRHDLPAEQRLEIAAGLLTRLWGHGVPPDHPFERVDDVATEWADLLEERMRTLRPSYDPGLVASGARLLRELPGTAGREVVVHGDFNPGNVLQSTREPWLVIDAKPMVGDPGYDLSPLLMQVDDPFGHPDPAAVLADRVGLLAGLTGEPVERLHAWSAARLVEAALWYASRHEPGPGADCLRRAGLTLDLLG
ncbi:aminoglycoside phosphotransferase family protein [Desertihabitans aurantiacus]|uniref:aminoglycoside phosphotransferase family protein n=1 Tax=Desertihabitans aurantiacus TaxID=2282477 RepID=UPI0018E57A93|nr:aminoglycoside phosphotransferase family protein [Desertihabitans aurantiacus]